MKSWEEAKKELSENDKVVFDSFYMTIGYHQDPALFQFWSIDDGYLLDCFPLCRNEVYMEMRYNSILEYLGA